MNNSLKRFAWLQKYLITLGIMLFYLLGLLIMFILSKVFHCNPNDFNEASFQGTCFGGQQINILGFASIFFNIYSIWWNCYYMRIYTE